MLDKGKLDLTQTEMNQPAYISEMCQRNTKICIIFIAYKHEAVQYTHNTTATRQYIHMANVIHPFFVKVNFMLKCVSICILQNCYSLAALRRFTNLSLNLQRLTDSNQMKVKNRLVRNCCHPMLNQRQRFRNLCPNLIEVLIFCSAFSLQLV